MARCARPRPARWLASVHTQNFFNAARASRRESTGCGRTVTTSRRRGTAFQPRRSSTYAASRSHRSTSGGRLAASGGSRRRRLERQRPAAGAATNAAGPRPGPDGAEPGRTCGICGLEEPPNPRRRSRRSRSAVLQWVQCDGSSCQRWFHLECLSVAPVDGDGDWFCPACLAAADSEDDEGNVLAPDVHA